MGQKPAPNRKVCKALSLFFFPRLLFSEGWGGGTDSGAYVPAAVLEGASCGLQGGLDGFYRCCVGVGLVVVHFHALGGGPGYAGMVGQVVEGPSEGGAGHADLYACQVCHGRHSTG